MKKLPKIIIIIVGIIIIILGITLWNKRNNKNIEKESEKVIQKDEAPKESEPYENKTTIESDQTDNKEEKELKYDQYVVANGFAGASDNVYYTRNKILYHLVISTNITTKLAEGVEKIEDDIDTVLVYKGENFKIIKEDNYVTYMES